MRRRGYRHYRDQYRSYRQKRRSTKVTEKKARGYYMRNKKKLVLPFIVTMIVGSVAIPKVKPYLSKLGIKLP